MPASSEGASGEADATPTQTWLGSPGRASATPIDVAAGLVCAATLVGGADEELEAAAAAEGEGIGPTSVVEA